MRLVAIRPALEDVGPEDTLGQVVVADEIRVAHRRQLTGGEHRLADVFDVAAIPPVVRAAGSTFDPQVFFDGARRRGADRLDHAPHVRGERAVALHELARRPVAPVGEFVHAPTEQRPVVDRDERRLVRPVFDEEPFPAAGAPCRAVQEVGVVGAEAAEQRHEVGSRDDVHRIHLQQAGPSDDPFQMSRRRRARRPTVGESLCRERDPPRLRRRDPLACHQRV